jgi:hypothetical protein
VQSVHSILLLPTRGGIRVTADPLRKTRTVPCRLGPHCSRFVAGLSVEIWLVHIRKTTQRLLGRGRIRRSTTDQPATAGRSGHLRQVSPPLETPPTTHLFAHLNQRERMSRMRAHAPHPTARSLASKRFRVSTTNYDHPQVEISGLGVRVPGGAPASRPRQTSQSAPGPLCCLRTTYAPLCRMLLLAESPTPEPVSSTDLARERSGASSSLFDRDCASPHMVCHRSRGPCVAWPAVEQPTIDQVGGLR